MHAIRFMVKPYIELSAKWAKQTIGKRKGQKSL